MLLFFFSLVVTRLLAVSVAQTLSGSVQTATPSATAPLGNSLQSQAPLPPKQAWCPSDIFCPGSLLQTVNIAKLYLDDKTFVDKPTSKGSQLVLADFTNISTSGSESYGQITDFVQADFKGEGLELQALQPPNFNPNPSFLNNSPVPIVKAFMQTVHGYWSLLIRGKNASAVCPQGPTGCESTLIPLNHSFVIPGGRFREQYYWDSFFVLEGLLQSELYKIANDTLQNFMDELEVFGFIPNGGRIYYLNRSQPPLFIHMLYTYINATGDGGILQRALPLAEKELQWWIANRGINVTSVYSTVTYSVYRYAVNNSAPRPESYLTDYKIANDPGNLNDTQRDALYAELASGAESGWDFTTRFTRNPDSISSKGLRSLDVTSTVPVDLNSIIYRSHVIMAGFYESSNKSAASIHHAAADSLRTAILDLFWDPGRLAFYDYNLGLGARNYFFTAASFYPVWNGIIPDELLSNGNNAIAYFSSVNMVLNRYNGTFPATFIDSGLQWDGPNSWPPHQYIILQALRSLPSNITSGPVPQPVKGQSTYSLIPDGQIFFEKSLPGQPIYSPRKSRNASISGAAADINALQGTVVNGGNAIQGEGWSAALQRQLANRYLSSCFCSWVATGGSITGLVPRLSDQELNVTQSMTNTGIMFEKFSMIDIDSAGRGGEYVVQAGFGWTNGVLLWIGSVYGQVLNAPDCPSPLDSLAATLAKNSAYGATSSKPLTMILFVAVLIIHLQT